jgi:hypothetical protein
LHAHHSLAASGEVFVQEQRLRGNVSQFGHNLPGIAVCWLRQLGPARAHHQSVTREVLLFGMDLEFEPLGQKRL